jgi:hypothetical protein
MQSQPVISSSHTGTDALCFFQIVKEQQKQPGSKARPKRAQTRLGLIFETGGGERDRTDDLLLAKQALSQLSYTPAKLAGGSGWIRTNDPRLIKTVL